MAESSCSVFNALIDIVSSPVKTFDEIRSHASWLRMKSTIIAGLPLAALFGLRAAMISR